MIIVVVILVFCILFPVARYQWLEEEDIRALPVASLVAPCGLVAVWVTNKRKLVEAVRERLFPYWGVQPLAEWIWIKVCTMLGKWQ